MAKSEKGQTGLEFAIVVIVIIIVFIASGFSIKKTSEWVSSRWEQSQKSNPAKTIIFSGKVVDHVTGQWPNDRLVVLFLNGKEVSRTKSELGEFIYSGEGKHDGLFVITVNNTYDLTEKDFNYTENQGVDFKTDFEKNWFFPKSKSVYRWFGDVEPGIFLGIPVKSKNLKFVLYTFEEPFDMLTAEIQQPGSLTIKQDRIIFVNGVQIP